MIDKILFALGVVLLAGCTGGPTGIRACDLYVSKYETCIRNKVPVDQQGLLAASFQLTRDSLINSAKSANHKALSDLCVAQLEATQKSLKPFACEW